MCYCLAKVLGALSLLLVPFRQMSHDTILPSASVSPEHLWKLALAVEYITVRRKTTNTAQSSVLWINSVQEGDLICFLWMLTEAREKSSLFTDADCWWSFLRMQDNQHKNRYRKWHTVKLIGMVLDPSCILFQFRAIWGTSFVTK